MPMVVHERSGTSENFVTTMNNFSSNNQICVQNHSKRKESSRFKGVNCQNNGHWGAQIYVNNQRIWLGTFKSEKEAAMAYDSAAIKLRNGDAHRNFPWTSLTVHEPQFQRQYDVETILVMIKDGSYMNKFTEYLKVQLQDGLAFPVVSPEVGIMGHELFYKELTPSDVGKLNRLVIPRRFAVKYFPPFSQELRDQDGEVISGVQDTHLYFYDRSRRSWRFRYCYWKSSQSFVFTRGWNRFVKEKDLRAKDIVVFSYLENYLMIDIRYSDARRNNVDDEDTSGLGEVIVEEENACLETIDYFANETLIEKTKGLRLFGVQIV